MKNIESYDVRLTGGFWKEKLELIRSHTIRSLYKSYVKTGRIRAFDFLWKQGEPLQPHFFWDSDVAKWVESVALLLDTQPDPELEALADAIIDRVEAHQEPDGYFNIYHTVVEPGTRFTDRNRHELYCAGHFMEAAVAYAKVTGKRKLLDCMDRYTDCIIKAFVTEKTARFVTPGHEEIELALVKMYRFTGNEKYLKLSQFFVESRGRNLKHEDEEAYAAPDMLQSQAPVRELTDVTGHSVRSMYYCSGIADLAWELHDESLMQAVERLYASLLKRMYVTGGIGSTNQNESFTVDYDLPNVHAYTETCAAIGVTFFSRRMQALKADSVFADTLERAAYNGALSGLSLDGEHFFYENPLEFPPLSSKDPRFRYPITQRPVDFGCSCCPPNLTRFVPGFAGNLYTVDGNTVYVQQFASSEAKIPLEDGEGFLTQETDYPRDGKVRLTWRGPDAVLKVRLPGWCVDYEGETEQGYAAFPVKDGDAVNVEFPMKPFFVEADPRVLENTGKVAVQYGPVVYCAEAVDNGPWLRDIRPGDINKVKIIPSETFGLPTLELPAYRHDLDDYKALYQPYGKAPLKECTLKLIPYNGFANRGETEMLVWMTPAAL